MTGSFPEFIGDITSREAADHLLDNARDIIINKVTMALSQLNDAKGR